MWGKKSQKCEMNRRNFEIYSQSFKIKTKYEIKSQGYEGKSQNCKIKG